VALALTVFSLATSDSGWVRWVVASTALGLTVAYTAFRALGGGRYGSALAQSALVLAASAAAYDSGFGVWRAATLSPLVTFFTVLQLRPGWLGRKGPLFAQDARVFVHAGAALVLVALFAELAQMAEWIAWAVAIALAAVAGGYALNRRLGGGEPEAVGALAAMGAAWTAGVHDIVLAQWGAVAMTPMLLVYAVAGRRSFSAYADYFVHTAAATVVVFLFLGSPGYVPGDWAMAATFAGLTTGYAVHRMLGAREPSGSFALAAFAVTWVVAVDALGISPWRGAALAPLAVVFSVLASRRWRFIPATTQYFTHAALLVAAGLVAVDMVRGDAWMPVVAVSAAAPFGLAYLLDLTLRRREESGIIALVLLGTAWVCGADALHLGIWRGAAIAPLAVVYAVIEARGARLGPIGELLGRHTRYLTHAAGAAALGFAFGDMIAAGHWIVWTGSLTVGVITAAYLVSAVLGRSLNSALLSQVAFGVTWSLISTDLNLGQWRGASLTALVAVYGLVTYRGRRLGPLGGLFARYGVYRAHAAAALALILTGYSVGAASAWLTGSITATFLGLAIAYGLMCFIGGPIEMAVIALAAFGLAWAGASHDLRLGQAFGACRAHVVAAHVVQHGSARVAGQAGCLEEGKHGDGHDGLLDCLARRADLRVVERRQPAEMDAEDQDQQDAGEEGGQGEADEGKSGGQVVEPGVLLDRGDHTDGDGQHNGDEVGSSDHAEVRRHTLQDQAAHRRAAGKGVPPITADERGRPFDVTHRHRLVQPKVVPNLQPDLGGHVLVRRKLAQRIARRQREQAAGGRGDASLGHDGLEHDQLTHVQHGNVTSINAVCRR